MYIYLLLISCLSLVAGESSASCSSKDNERYLLYDVNLGEGFNLRRDVFVRFANLVHDLNLHGTQKWILVLPTWHSLYHWSKDRRTPPKPWADFFHLESIQRYVPVMEMDEYIIQMGASVVDEVKVLQNYAEGWGGQWEDKMEERPCIQDHGFSGPSTGPWLGVVGGRSVRTPSVSCLSMQGSAVMLGGMLKECKGKSVALLHGEVALHDQFGGVQYWRARRAMRYALPLAATAEAFLTQRLGVAREELARPADWRREEKKSPPRLGGAFLAVHLRRRDFLRARPTEVPSIAGAARQIRGLCGARGLGRVFVASDGSDEELASLTSLLAPLEVFRFTGKENLGDEGEALGDGQVAVVDQIIASYARFFVGSHESTFSFRIQEEREILGFPSSTTFNRLCGGEKEKCDQPSKWHIVY